MKKISVKGPIVSNNTAWLYKYLGWDAACPNTVLQGLEKAAGDDVVIEINSPGGICVYGYEMYTAIKEYEGKVTIHVICAMSAATLLVCAADEALISDTGIFMIHNARTTAEGDYRDMNMKADALREINQGIINAYVRKTGKSREDIQSLMDNNSYMSPQTAIEQGFIDGYMFGDPNRKGQETESFVESVVAAAVPVIPENKAKTLIQLITEVETKGHELPDREQSVSSKADSDKTKKKGESKMELKEYLAKNPEHQSEVDAMLKAAREEGRKEERERMHSLDAISKTVTAESLYDAKYGEKPVDGPTLAYQAMINGDKTATAYLKAAMEDSNGSGAADVGIGMPDTGEEEIDESDEMAAYVNRVKGGK